jgi:phospholipase C
MLAGVLLAVVVLATAGAGAGNRTTTKVVTLMLENRSFSHLLGFLRKELTGKEFNRWVPSVLRSRNRVSDTFSTG